MTEQPDPAALLQEEFKELAPLGIERALKCLGVKGPRGLHELSKIVEQRHHDKWSGTKEDRAEAVKATLREAAEDDSLSEPIGNITHRRMAEVMYELVEIDPALLMRHRNNKRYSTLLNILREGVNPLHPLSPEHFDRATGKTRELLARSLAGLVKRVESHGSRRRLHVHAPAGSVRGTLMAALRAGENRFDSPLRSKLRALTWDEGVLRADLYDFLGSELRDLWHIVAGDSSETVLVKVVWQLERLVPQLSLEQHRLAARYSYNITGIQAVERLQLGERWKALADGREHQRLSDDMIRDYMTYVILPLFESSIRVNPPPAAPPETATMVLERAARGERITAIMASLTDFIGDTGV